MGGNIHHPFLAVGRFLLIFLAFITTVLCCFQQFGLLIVSFHWYVGWTAMDHVALERSKERRENFRRLGLKDGYRHARIKFLGALLLPLFFVWAMLSFVLTATH